MRKSVLLHSLCVYAKDASEQQRNWHYMELATSWQRPGEANEGEEDDDGKEPWHCEVEHPANRRQRHDQNERPEAGANYPHHAGGVSSEAR